MEDQAPYGKVVTKQPQLQANELRIGNWVLVKCTAKELRGVDDFEVQECNVHNIASMLNNDPDFKYKPIPLTEEWLLKFGFDEHKSIILPSYQKSISWNGGDFKVISITIQHGNQYIYLRHGDRNLPREDDDLICVFNGDINGKLYVHQLQNLYFALTGSELIYYPKTTQITPNP